MRRSPAPRGQGTAEFALVLPILLLVGLALVLLVFYLYRAAAADLAVFALGEYQGAYGRASAPPPQSWLPWPDLVGAVGLEASDRGRYFKTELGFSAPGPEVLGVRIAEAHGGTFYYRLWRFYPGRPPGAY